MIIAKSLGTYAAMLAAERQLPAIWLTPLLHIEAIAEAIGRKIREEAEELIEAADEPDEAGRQHAIYEAGDLIYHAMVLMAWRGIELDEVAAELARREGTSGLVEKASRPAKKDSGTADS